jgi:hypothetical protein
MTASPSTRGLGPYARSVTEPVWIQRSTPMSISLQADAGHSGFEIADWAGASEEMISRVCRHRLRRVAELWSDGGRPPIRPSQYRKATGERLLAERRP